MENRNYFNNAYHYRNDETKDTNGTITVVKMNGMAAFCCNYRKIEQGVPFQMSSYFRKFEDAERSMLQKGYKPDFVQVVYPNSKMRKLRLFSYGGKAVSWDQLPNDFKLRYFPAYFDESGRDYFPFLPTGE